MNVLTQPKVVLLVDDEKHFFDVYAWQLEEFPSLKFIHAESGHEAYELMGQQKIDVVISDINMPNGNGLWLLEKLSAEYADIPVIIASSNVGLNEAELKNLGASAFIPKIELNSLNSKFRDLF
jgi:CheY-like chemotaxis protein